MVIVNNKEDNFCIIHANMSDEEDKSYLCQALFAAIRWNGYCPGNDKPKRDGQNLINLTNFLEDLVKSTMFKDDTLSILIKSTSPREQKDNLLTAIAAAIRWFGMCGEDNQTNEDCNNLQTLATLLEQMVEVKEVK